MNDKMDRRGFLKAMMVIAGSVVVPGLISAGPRESAYAPSMKPMISRFDPDDAKQADLRSRARFMYKPGIASGIYRNMALSRNLRFATIAEARGLQFVKPAITKGFNL